MAMRDFICIAEGCDKPTYARQLCNAHYQKKLKYGDPNSGYTRVFYAGRKCIADGCKEPAYCKACCVRHYNKLHRYGSIQEPDRKGAYGSGYLMPTGYRGIRGRREHVVVAERALGKPLPSGAVVHHVNHVRSDNQNENLVICPSEAYHHLIHVRERALNACGNPNWRKCVFCKDWDALENMRANRAGNTFKHPACDRTYQAQQRNRKRIEEN